MIATGRALGDGGGEPEVIFGWLARWASLGLVTAAASSEIAVGASSERVDAGAHS